MLLSCNRAADLVFQVSVAQRQQVLNRLEYWALTEVGLSHCLPDEWARLQVRVHHPHPCQNHLQQGIHHLKDLHPHPVPGERRAPVGVPFASPALPSPVVFSQVACESLITIYGVGEHEPEGS